MTAVITAPTEASEPLAPATQAATGRTPAGGFDLLMALLQTTLTPGMPSPIVPCALVDDAAATASESVVPTVTVPALRVLRGLVADEAGATMSTEASLVASNDDEAHDDALLSSEAASAALAATVIATPVPLTVPTGTLAPRVSDDQTARPSIVRGVPTAPGVPPGDVSLVDAPPVDALSVDALPVNALPAHGSPVEAPLATPSPSVDASAQAAESASGSAPLAPRAPVAPTDAGMAALQPRARFERSTRTVDAFRAAAAAAALASVREDVAQRLDAATSMARGAAGAEERAERFGAPSPETEREGADSSVDSAFGAAPIPGAAIASRGTETIAASARPEPARDPIDQIATRLRDVRGPGHHEISVRLDPPELGAVRIDARLDGARLQLHIRAEHAPTGELLADALPRLRDTLAQQGFVPTEVTVHLGLDASPRQFTRDDAPTFTPPRGGEPTLTSPVVRLPAARAVVASDGLDVWA